MSKQLLIEHSFFTPTINLHEGLKNQNGNLIVRGKVQASDKPNANRRVYPYETLFEQVKKYVDGPIKEKRALGELDHPESSITYWIFGGKVKTFSVLSKYCLLPLVTYSKSFF
jgi:hypothetical protein